MSSFGTLSSTPTSTGSGAVHVRFNTYNQFVNLAGLTVREALDTLHRMWGTEKDASVFHGKEKLQESDVLQAGMNLEFIKRSGEKGE